MRFKRRYFCVEILYQDDINALNKIQWHKLKYTNLSETIHESIERLYGDWGMATLMPSFSVIYFNSITNLAILRTSRDMQKKFATLLMFTTRLAQFNVTFKTVHVAGSIKKCKKFLVNYCQQKLTEFNQMKSEINVDESELNTAIDVVEKLIETCEVNDNVLNFK